MRTLQLFLACQTQWRQGAMGGVMGLDYAGVDVVLRAQRAGSRRRAFDELQLMERAALPLLNEPRDE